MNDICKCKHVLIQTQMVSMVLLLFVLIPFTNSVAAALQVIYKSCTLLPQVKLFGTLVLIPRTKVWTYICCNIIINYNHT